MKVTIWNEFQHEQNNAEVRKIYPDGIHGALKNILQSDDVTVTTATLDMPEHGLTAEVLDSTDVLVWWGHMAHHLVDDAVVERVAERVLKGMGLVVLHSGHHSKIFRRLMGTTCNLRWRAVGERERVWVVEPTHPIAQGLPKQFLLPHEEMYGERFDIPAPEQLVLMSWFEGGEVFRSGCCYTRGNGKIFYFRPGHEEYPTFYDENVKIILRNAVQWAKPTVWLDKMECPWVNEPLEPIK